MDKKLRDAYYEYCDELARAGIVDHALNNAILKGKTVEEHIVEVLRAAGRLPEGLGWEPLHVTGFDAGAGLASQRIVKQPDRRTRDMARDVSAWFWRKAS